MNDENERGFPPKSLNILFRQLEYFRDDLAETVGYFNGFAGLMHEEARSFLQQADSDLVNAALKLHHAYVLLPRSKGGAGPELSSRANGELNASERVH